RFLEIGGVPVRHGATDGFTILVDAKHLERHGAMVREVAMEVAPSAVAAGIETHDAVARRRNRTVAELHVGPAAQRGGGLAQIDRDLLAATGTQFPEVRSGES